MAKTHYSADSAPPPHAPSGLDTVKTQSFPTVCLKGTLQTIKAYVLTGANADISAYIGETADLSRRLPEHVSRRKARPSDTATLSID